MKATIINIITCCLVPLAAFTSCKEDEEAEMEHMNMEKSRCGL